MGIRAKLVLCLLAVLLPLIAVSIFTINLLEKQLVERTESALANTLRLESARINENLAAYAQDAKNLTSSPNVKHFVSATNDYRNALRRGIDTKVMLATPLGGFDGFAIVNRNSEWPLQQLALDLQRRAGMLGSNVAELRIVDTLGETLGETMGFSWQPTDSTVLQRSLTSATTIFGDAFVNANDAQRLGIVSPIIDDSGNVAGALLLETRLNRVTYLVSKHEGVGQSSEAYISQSTPDGNTMVITPLRFDRTAAFNKVIAANKSLPTNIALHSPRAQVLHTADYRGVQTIAAVQSITATSWGLVVKMDAAEAFAPVLELRRILIITTISSVVFVLACYMFCLVPIARRLQRTAQAANKIMNGDLTTRVSDKINDEVGHLARTIDTLARDLESDQKKRTEVEARLRHQALHDELTGLLNRKYANKVIKRLNGNKNKRHTVMFLDLNGFKDVNDLYGHAAGDEVLISVAQRLSKQIGNDVATLARWGGDEFVVILPEHDEGSATEVALTLQNAFDEPIRTSQGVHQISCSIGLATSSDSKSLDEVLMEADVLMYEQKKLQQESQTKGNMASRTVQRALSEERVEAWYQPVVNMKSSEGYTLAGAEVLVRLRSREGGIILPEDFLAAIDSNKLGKELDLVIFSYAISTLARWQATGMVDEKFHLFLNLSTQSLNDPTFCQHLSEYLQFNAIAAERIIIELPYNIRTHRQPIMRLDELGVAIALVKLKAEPVTQDLSSRLSAEMAKIDRRWLEDSITAPHMIAICDELNLDIVVEGIETHEQISTLQKLGIEHFQGKLFGLPLRPVDFISRWGESSLPESSQSQSSASSAALRLAG